MKKVIILLLLNVFCFGVFSQSEITESEIKEHILFLTSEANAGRNPGGEENEQVVNYIEMNLNR